MNQASPKEKQLPLRFLYLDLLQEEVSGEHTMLVKDGEKGGW